MGIASYNVQLRTRAQKKNPPPPLSMFAIGKVHICLPKKPPTRKYAKGKYHQSLLHATKPQATTRLNSRAISRFYSWNSHHDK